MIRESLYFTFAGRPSTDFNIYNVSLGDGLYEEPLTAGKTISNVKVPNNPIPYFHSIERDTLSFPVRFYFDEGFNNELIKEVVNWLDVDYFEPLAFSSNFDQIYYAMPVEGITEIHNGLEQGYLELTMKCNSPFKYSPVITNGWYDFSFEHDPNSKKFSHRACSCGCSSSPSSISIYNLGDFELKPVFHIEKVWDGEIQIENTSVFNQTFLLSNLKDGEKITIDCNREFIETNLKNTYRHNDSNETFIRIPKGKNKLLIIKGSCRIRVDYEYTYK
ncbi:phage tail domain-containing protein [Bacillus sp. Marseille-P3800]|uniref:phage tail domain-containing protein n=1 Tax=Bacillus sp. Marseille-P3800 TaxID=2014782 RepID=UPI000C06F31A|nr:phage tail domain-containing protein [Bacillus sp. Marseille-P3800]